MNVLDLFSGIGGFSLGLEWAGMTTKAFCEIDPFCQSVLRRHWPGVPIHDDIRTLPAIGGIDLICGGFPCQPWSVAGKQLGASDERHLWPAMSSCISRERPAWVIGENVTGIVRAGLDPIFDDLENLGYAWRAFIVPACAVGAPQKRERVWIVAHSKRKRGCCGEFARENAMDANSRGQGGGFGSHGGWWTTEPAVGRLVNGVSGRLARLKALGNAVVPQVVEVIGRAIMATESAV